MTEQRNLPYKAGTSLFIKEMPFTRELTNPRLACAMPASTTGKAKESPASVLSVAELRQIVMQILG